ncbi:MAG: ABC transporter ATP-binding protein/permease [Clostridia bacterium]|nr:ABC transporter ATP-binding protein/permease [Clostridia bacterium]
MPINSFKEDETLKETLNIKTIIRLFSYLGPYKVQVMQTLGLMGGVIAIELMNPYFLKLGIDRFIKLGDVKGLILLGGFMIIINLIGMLCARYRIRIMAGVTNKILLTIRQNLYDHIQKLSFAFFDNRPVGKILARIIGDVNSLNDLFTNSITSLIPDFIKIITVAVIMLCMNYRLAAVSFIALPILLASLFVIQVVSRRRWQIYRKKTSNINAFVHEDFSGIRVVQSYTAENSTSETFLRLLKEQQNAFLRAVRLNDMFWPLVEMSWGVGTIVVFWYGLRLLETGSITIGLMIAFIGYISMFWQPIMNISNFYNALVTNISGAERIFEIMDIEPDIKDAEEAILLPKIKGAVTFKHVTFGYDENSPVLKDVSFQVKPGETIALVGPTGVGKTTVVNLISRFYDHQKGEVLIDGYNISKVKLESLRSQMGIMLQDTFLFSGSIKDNIRYGKLDATDGEILEAAKAVHAHEFITKLLNGYDTDVNERGSRLSVGQRQLIAFARALLADPRILILDEATASIDTHTERLVQSGIQKLLKGRTSFVIAHRLSTIQNADRIMVIDQGRVTETGSHQELMGLKGLYHKLFTSQYKFLEDKQIC